MSEIKIDAQVIDSEPYVNLIDLLEWMTSVYDELKVKNKDVNALYAVMENLHSQSTHLRKQIENSKESTIMNVKKSIEENKVRREERHRSDSDL